MPESNTIVQVDINPNRLGRRAKIQMGLCGDMKDTLDELIPLIHQKEDNSFLREQLAKYEKVRGNLRSAATVRGKEEKIQPEYVISVVDKLSSDDRGYGYDLCMGCPLFASYGYAEDVGIIQSWLDGERHAASDRGGIGLSRQASRGVVW